MIIILVANSLTIYFGLSYFDFRTGDSLNEKYTFKENIYLIGLYLLIYLFLGIIALIPNDILQKGFILYEIQKRDKNYPTRNGLIFVYLFSMVASSICKILLDRKYVFDKVKLIIDLKNKEIDTYSFTSIIIIIYALSMVFSLSFYGIYQSIFKKTDDKDSDTSHQAIKVFGYVIYIQKTPGVCCADCGIGLNKFGYCLGCDKYNCCCCCCSDMDDVTHGTKELCIIYKLKGVCSWVCDLLCGYDMFKFACIIIMFDLINIGFNPEMSEYLNNNINEKEILIINIISFSSIIFFYFLNLIVGYFHLTYSTLGKIAFENINKAFKGKLSKSSELQLIAQPFTVFLLLMTIINTIISALVHYNAINNKKYYFIAFSTAISEYGNIILAYITEAEISVDIVKKSFAISFYKSIFWFFELFLGIFNIKNEGFIFFQFIFGIVYSSLFSLILICGTIGIRME